MIGLLLTAICSVRAESAFSVPVGQRQLFLDGEGIEKIDILTRTMHPPNKKGAVIRPDLGIGQAGMQYRTGPHWDLEKQVFMLWDSASEPNELHAKGISTTGHFWSTDGLHWTKPNMGQVEFRGSRDNNFVSVMIDGRTHRIDYVVYDPIDPDPSRRYKGWVAMNPGGQPYKQPVVSDGLTWKKLEVPAIPNDINDGNLSFDLENRLFIGGLEMSGPYGRAWAITTSRDFEHWSEPKLVFHADELDQQLGREQIEKRLADPAMLPLATNKPDQYRVNVYNMGVFRYESLYIGLPAMFHETGDNDGFMIVQLTCSRDLNSFFQRLGDRKPFIEPSRLGSGAYDLTQILGPGSTVVRGDEMWFYYCGLKYRGQSQSQRTDPDTGAICLAVLRRDGFMSLDASDAAGTVRTRAFKLTGTKLLVNVDAPAGDLRIKVFDGNGNVIARSRPLSGDLASEAVQWAKGDLAAHTGRAVRLEFSLRNGQLYSYWVE